MSFKGRDMVSIRDFSKEEIYKILDVAKDMVETAKGEKQSDILKDHILATLFFEPSTRTRLSFESAMNRLGGSVINISGIEGSSLVKGESLSDTIKMAESYADIIVLRHPFEGAARLSGEVSKKPLINGGDGAGQHPTQTLLDLFTIREELGAIDGKDVALIGDLKYGRTVHSLSYALALLGAKVNLVAPELLQMPNEVIDHLSEIGQKPTVFENLEDVIDKVDVVYMTRIQKERFADPNDYKKVAKVFTIRNSLLKNARDDLIILHPLPRVGEIHPEVDSTKHALYFKQAFNGVPVRMALLGLLLGAIE
jgi:aspartate carbamoyltransferase catalytic subunit